MNVPDRVRRALDETGLPWEIENGGIHRKIRLAGYLVGILPKGKANNDARRTELNIVSQIRRQGAALR
jgi:hypothetical protein